LEVKIYIYDNDKLFHSIELHNYRYIIIEGIGEIYCHNEYGLIGYNKYDVYHIVEKI
jgi:hypothetical protein